MTLDAQPQPNSTTSKQQHNEQQQSMDLFTKQPRCEALAHPNVTETTISLIILVGISVSYFPQHLRIITRRSSEGLSPYFVLLGTTSSSFALFNILTLPITQTDIGCCRVNAFFSCFAGTLGVIQVFTQWACFGIM
jgi:uncharacterized protein with PQ loop repeat